MWRGPGRCRGSTLLTVLVSQHRPLLTAYANALFLVVGLRLAVDVRVDPPPPSPGAGSTSSAAHTTAAKATVPHSGARALSTSALNSAGQPGDLPSTSSGGSQQGSRAYGGTFDCLRRTYQAEGMRGVYAGFGVSLAGTMQPFFVLAATPLFDNIHRSGVLKAPMQGYTILICA